MKRLITFLVELDPSDWDYEEVREKVGSGEADLVSD